MKNKDAAILLGDHDALPHKLWGGFVRSGLVEHIAAFSSVNDLTDAVATMPQSIELDVKLVFFYIRGPEDLSIPVQLKQHEMLSRVPLIAFYAADSGITETDVQTLYERRVSSVVGLPLRFHELGQLVLYLNRYWSIAQFPECPMSLPRENLYTPPSSDSPTI